MRCRGVAFLGGVRSRHRGKYVVEVEFGNHPDNSANGDEDAVRLLVFLRTVWSGNDVSR